MKFEKYLSAILGPSIPGSVAILKKEFGNVLSWVLCVAGLFVFSFLKKTGQKKWIFKNGKQFKEVTLVLESLLKLFKEHDFHCIAYFGASPTI